MKEELSENNRTVPQPGIIACLANIAMDKCNWQYSSKYKYI